MSATIDRNHRLVLSDGRINPESGRTASVVNAAAPLVLGLIGPVIVMLMIDPTALRQLQFLLIALLMPILAGSLLIYIYSVLNPGEIAGVVVDSDRQVIELHQANAFTSRKTDVPFREIVSIRLVSQYDQDGYASPRVELLIDGNDPISLPASFGQAEEMALRQAVGLA